MKQFFISILTWILETIKRFFLTVYLLCYALLFIGTVTIALFIAWFLVFLKPVKS